MYVSGTWRPVFLATRYMLFLFKSLRNSEIMASSWSSPDRYRCWMAVIKTYFLKLATCGDVACPNLACYDYAGIWGTYTGRYKHLSKYLVLNFCLLHTCKNLSMPHKMDVYKLSTYWFLLRSFYTFYVYLYWNKRWSLIGLWKVKYHPKYLSVSVTEW